MNVTCEQCGAQYAVSDHKLQGADRVFNIRCKECNAIMAIRGIDNTEANNIGPEWYYADEGQQVGPVDSGGLQEAVDNGRLNADTLVWRTGMDDWKPASTVEEMAFLFHAAQANEPVNATREDEPALQPVHEMSNADDATQMLEMPQDMTSDDGSDEEMDMDVTQVVHMPSAMEDAAPRTTTMDAIGQPLEFDEGASADAAENAHEARVENGNNASAEEASASAEDTSETDEEDVSKESTESEASEPARVDSSILSVASEAPSQEGKLDNPAEKNDELFRTIEAPSPWANYDSDDDHDEDLVNKTFDDLVLSEKQSVSQDEADENMVWERNENSVLFSLDDAPAPPSRRNAPSRSRVVSTNTDSSEESSLIDIGSFRKKKRDQTESNDLFGSLSGSNSQIAANKARSRGSQRHSTAGVLPGMRRKQKASARMRTVGMLAAAILSGILTTGIIFYFVDGPGEDDPGTATPPAKSIAVNGEVPVPETHEGIQENAPKSVAVPESANTTDGTATPEKAAKLEAETAAADPPDTSAEAPVNVAEAKKPAAEESAASPTSSDGKIAEEKAEPTAIATTAPAKKVQQKPLSKKAKQRAARRKAKAAERKEKKAAQKEAKRLEKERKKAEAARAATEAKKVAEKKKAASSDNDPNALLNKARKKTGSDLANAPSRLTTGQVRRVVRRANSRVRSCAQAAGLSGIRITVKFTIMGAGTVNSVQVTGPAAGTTAGPCVKGAISGLRFPTFNGSQRVTYPFMVK